MSKPKNYYKNQHKPRAQIFSINYLAQAIVSIIDSNPVKARSNPTILIKKDEDYTKVEIVFCFCLRPFKNNMKYGVFQLRLSIKNGLVLSFICHK